MDIISELVNEMVAFIYLKKADYLFRAGKYQKSLKDYMKAAERYLALEEYSQLGFAYRRIAECYHDMKVPLKEDERKNHRTSIAYYSKAAEAFTWAGGHLYAGDCYENASKTFEDLGEIDETLEYALKSTVSYEKSGDMLSTSHAYLYTAGCLEKIGELEKAALAYEKAGGLNMQISDYRKSASSYISAANCYKKMGLFEKAIGDMANSTNASLKMRDYSQMAETYGEMAELYLKTDDFKNSVYYHKKAAELKFDNQDYGGSGLSYFRIGELHDSRKDFQSALGSYLQSAKASLNAKKFEQAAVAYEKAGECYEKLGDMLKASEHYIYAAKTSTSAGKTRDAVRAFGRAGRNLVEQAEARLIEKDYRGAVLYYEKAVECFEGMEEYSKAGEVYVKKAESHLKAMEEQKAGESYAAAAENYLKAGDLDHSGYNYKMAGGYEKSAIIYLRYAEKKSADNDDFQAGEAYKHAARAYSKEGADAERRESYNKAIFYYDKVRKGKSNLKEPRLNADSSESMGECYLDMSDLKNAERYFAEAVVMYRDLGFTLGENLSNAFLGRVRGELSLELGRHAQSLEFLKTSLKLFGVVIASGRFDSDYVGYLSEQKSAVENLIYKIERKPDIELLTNNQSYTFTDTVLVVNAVLKNNGSYPICSISFLSHLPEEFRVLRLPLGIRELKPADSVVVSAEFTIKKAGEYVIMPFEIFYTDDHGNKYVKASNESSIVVDERPPEDFKNFRLAVEVYLRYARMQLSNKNYFYAGEGFKKAAEVYGRFNTDERLREYHQSAIDTYSEYVKMQPKDTADPVRLEKTGDALWNIAESSEVLGRLDDAISNYRESVVYYRKANAHDKTSMVNALVAKTEAKKAIEHGDYSRASEMLTQAIGYFNEALNAGGMDASKLNFIQKHNSEAINLVDRIKNVPVVVLTARAPRETLVGKTFTIYAVMTNLGDLTLRNIRFILKTPEEFAVMRTPPQIAEASPKSTQNVSIEMSANKKGDYVFKPLDVFYTDEKNNGYMHGSNQVAITVVEEESSEREGKTVREEAGGKPDVTVRMSEPPLGVKETAFTMKAVVENNTSSKLSGIRFLVNAPQDFEVLETPEVIKELDANAREAVSMRVLPRSEGTYTFRPLEIFYRDVHGNGLFNSSDEVTVRVVPADKAMLASSKTIEGGFTYLLEDEDRASAVNLLKKQMEEGCACLYITRLNPEQIKKTHSITDVRFIWLTNLKEGDYVAISSTQDVSIAISAFIESGKKTFILLEGIEYLIDQSGFTVTLEFLKFQRDKISKKDARLLVLANPSALDPKHLQRMEHECILYVK